MSATEPEVIAPEPKKKKHAIQRVQEVAIAPREVVDINSLMVHAVQSGNIETMERVMAIRRELKAEAAREAFFAALSAFQRECPVIKKTKPVKDSGGVRYRYAPLDVIVSLVSELLTKHGLSYTIESHVVGTGDEGALEAVCKVYHEAGHMESSRFSVPIEPPKFMSKPQTFGAASTFAKRYAFCNALGILTGDEDNDALGQYVQKAPEPRKPVSQPKPTPTAQKAAQAANGPTGRPDLEPAMNPDEAIDAATIKGLRMAMEHAALGDGDFKARFPKLLGLEQVKKVDARVIMSWIADPVKR